MRSQVTIRSGRRRQIAVERKKGKVGASGRSLDDALAGSNKDGVFIEGESALGLTQSEGNGIWRKDMPESLGSLKRTIITLYLWMEGGHASRGSLGATVGGRSIFFYPEDKSIFLWPIEASFGHGKYTMAERNLVFNMWDLILLREVGFYFDILGSKYGFYILGY
ncbi:hypothetical protein TIFTF001_025837 [Ficus carica]|uniref:Uncharacterized protein n=1 Tax=Ficus carica TaxID=3494 RepID=A0AA88B1N1_FICCA|nr:hypothetical protein TIFTF001_025837 [Ficus carica]